MPRKTTELTYQQIFDRSVGRLLKQGKKSGRSMVCQYHHANGRRCAIGVLIPKRYYSPKMEGKSVGHLFRNFSIQMSNCGFSEVHKGLLQNLQGIHDSNPVHLWRQKFRDLAAQRDLDTRVLDKAA